MRHEPKQSAKPFVPNTNSPKVLSEAAKICRGCHLYKQATQTVFGRGNKKSIFLIVGEQPGDQEDIQGQAFVGPAGKILTKALIEAGIESESAYITNAVKHFKFDRSGKKRIHQKPNTIEIAACHPWLEAEINVIAPKLIICLGATAARSVMAKVTPVLKNRGKPIEGPWPQKIFITVHPSSILRVPGSKERKEAYENFVKDLASAKAFAKSLPTK